MRIGLEIKIDVTRIDKSKIFEGKKGKYVTLTTFINTSESDQYGNHGPVSQAASKEEREKSIRPPIIGNAKIFFMKGSSENVGSDDSGYRSDVTPDDGDIPF